MVKYKAPRNIFLKSAVVGLVLLFLDFLAHSSFTEIQETGYYFLAKPIIAGYVAYMMFLGIFNIFNIKKGSSTGLYYVYYATLFALIHGVYYRVIEFMQGNPFFFRVRDVMVGNIVYPSSSILIGTLAWWVIHGGAFLVGIWIAKQFVGRK